MIANLIVNFNSDKKATRVYYALNNTIFGEKEIKTTKLCVCNSIMVPILLYKIKTWVTNKKLEGAINAPNEAVKKDNKQN